MAGEQPAPNAIAEHCIAHRLPSDRSPGAGAGLRQALENLIRPFHQEGEREERWDRKKAGPDNIGQHVHLARRAGDHIAARPADRGPNDKGNAQRRCMAVCMRQDDAKPRERQREGSHLKQANPLFM